MEDEGHYEYTVFDDLGRRMPFANYTTPERAEEYISWIKERNEAIKERALTYESVIAAGGFPDTNLEFIQWNHRSDVYGKEDGGLKDRTYSVWRRKVYSWRPLTREF